MNGQYDGIIFDTYARKKKTNYDEFCLILVSIKRRKELDLVVNFGLGHLVG